MERKLLGGSWNGSVVTTNNKSISITKIKVTLKIKGRELSSRGETIMTVCK